MPVEAEQGKKLFTEFFAPLIDGSGMAEMYDLIFNEDESNVIQLMLLCRVGINKDGKIKLDQATDVLWVNEVGYRLCSGPLLDNAPYAVSFSKEFVPFQGKMAHRWLINLQFNEADTSQVLQYMTNNCFKEPAPKQSLTSIVLPGMGKKRDRNSLTSTGRGAQLLSAKKQGSLPIG